MCGLFAALHKFKLLFIKQKAMFSFFSCFYNLHWMSAIKWMTDVELLKVTMVDVGLILVTTEHIEGIFLSRKNNIHTKFRLIYMVISNITDSYT